MIAKEHHEKLESIKKDIEQAYQYFEDNYKRFYEYKRFVFATSLSDDDSKTLKVLGKPDIEVNVLEAYISRLLGEFATQEPGVEVRAADGMSVKDMNQNFLALLDVIEGHCRHILDSVSNDNLEYSIYNDQLAGGFAVMRVYTDYINAMSFEQGIYIGRVFDPTLCGFDPMARESHKGDGRFCFEISPYTKAMFMEEFGADKVDGIRFNRADNINSFNWSYRNEQEDIALVADFYVKVRKRAKIVLLANGEIATKRQYEKRLEEWNNDPFEIAQAPVVVEERWTTLETIDLYRLCENKILDHYETDCNMLPLIFVDGNSVYLRESQAGASTQMTRPYVYHAKGIQKLYNFSVQTIGAEIENMVQHKIKVPIEAIPEKYQDAYQNVQQAQTLVYYQFYEGDITARLDPPQEIMRTPTPPIVMETYMSIERKVQAVLGSYDGLLGSGQKDLSGKAIQAGAVQSSAASDPYLVNFIRALNRALLIVVDLIPKYYKTPRSLPIMTRDGKRSYQIINDEAAGPENMNMDYDPTKLQIKVEAGVNTEVEKQISLEKIIQMSAASPLFAEFINAKGLPTIMGNLNIRGIDTLKEMAEEFMQKRAQAEEQAAGQPTDTDKVVQAEIKKAELEAHAREQKTIADTAINVAKAAISREEVELKRQELELKAAEAHARLNMDRENQAAAQTNATIGLAVDVMRQQSQENGAEMAEEQAEQMPPEQM